jgi:N-formylglutamate amidohydrolase
MTGLWRHVAGDGPLIVNVPHAGTHVPVAMTYTLTEAGAALPDTDWHVDALYDFAPEMGAQMLVATHARIVVDLNRDPEGVPLYPGADNTELCPTRTFDNRPIWREGAAPGPEEARRRAGVYWRPYHDKLAALIAETKARHGYCILLDGHSIRSRVPRFFEGALPDLNLGTADGRSCNPALQAQAAAALAQSDRFSHVVNGRFKGGYITRHYGRPADRVHALQLETAISAYADEAAPETYDPVRAQPLREALRRLVGALIAARL